MENGKVKPSRTLGVSLAILASVMLFTILPLLQVAMIGVVRLRLRSLTLDVPGEPELVAPMAAGGAFEGVSDFSLIVQTVLGVVFLIIAVYAWRGRPRWIRLVLLGAVLLLTAVTILLSLMPLVTAPDFSGGIDSGAQIAQVLLSGRMILSILVALYVVWYLNRGPARAFYRGYYLTPPKGTLEADA